LTITRNSDRCDNDSQNNKKFLAEVLYNNSTPTQSLLSDLKKLGIDNIFPNEIKNLSTQLDPLIGIIVKKINLITCTEDLVGLFKPGEIQITYEDKVPAVLIFEVVVKPAVELIEDIASSNDFFTTSAGNLVGDPMVSARALGLSTFAKKDNFTQKFFNRSALYFGTLRYGKSLSSTAAGIETGKTGIFQNFIIYPDNVSPTIRFLSSVTRLSDKVITWQSSNLEQVDRFEIYDSSDQRNIKLLSRAATDINKTDFSVVIPINVTKINIQAILKNGSGASIEAIV
jgi:hypothetical protein